MLLPSLLLMAAGLVLFTRAPAHATYLTDILPVMVLLGIGAGLSFPALMTLAMSQAGPQDAGLASGLVNTTQQVGGALGLAVLATLASSRTERLRSSGHDVADALVGGYHLAFAIGAVLLMAAVAVGAIALRSVAQPDDEDPLFEDELLALDSAY